MIDLDSLCSLMGYETSLSAIPNVRYISTKNLGLRKKDFTALHFVYLQVIFIAESWIQKKKNDDVDAKDLLLNSGRLSSALTVDVNVIRVVLDDYQRCFTALDEAMLALQGASM
jgi:hypothetical protein